MECVGIVGVYIGVPWGCHLWVCTCVGCGCVNVCSAIGLWVCTCVEYQGIFTFGCERTCVGCGCCYMCVVP